MALIRRGPLDETTEHGRAADRHRRIIWSGGASSVAQVVSILAGLVSLPLTVGYLGAERYGLWIAISAWLQLFAFSDLGVCNALVNLLSEANGRRDVQAARRHFSTAFFLLWGISAILICAFVVISPHVPWGHVFNLKRASGADEARNTVLVLATFFFIEIPLGTINRVYASYQQGYISSIWQIAGSITSLISIIVVAHFKLGLPYLALSIAGSRSSLQVLNLSYLFFYEKPWLRPSFGLINRASARRLFGTGILYSMANIGFLLEVQAPYIVGPHAIGLAALGSFGVAHRMYSTAVTLPLMFLGPLWPAYGEAFARGDIRWVRETLARSRRICLGCGIPIVGSIILLGPFVVTKLMRGKATVDRPLLALLGCWFFMRMWREVHSMLLNGGDNVFGQATYGLGSALLEIGLAYILGTWFGADGMTIGWIAGFMLLAGWLMPWQVHRQLGRWIPAPAGVAEPA